MNHRKSLEKCTGLTKDQLDALDRVAERLDHLDGHITERRMRLRHEVEAANGRPEIALAILGHWIAGDAARATLEESLLIALRSHGQEKLYTEARKS